MLKTIENKKGAYTLEATIVSVVSMMIILLLIYMGIYMYQKVKIQIVATNASQRVAETYTEETKDMYISKVRESAIRDVDPYWRFAYGSRNEAATGKVKDYIGLYLNAFNILSEESQSQNVKLNNYFFLFRDVEVQLEYDIIFPFPTITNYWSQAEKERFVGYSKSTISEPSEFIRNMLLAEDFMREMNFYNMDDLASTVGESWNTLKDIFPSME